MLCLRYPALLTVPQARNVYDVALIRLALALVLPPWAAALVVGGVATLAGLAAVLVGRRELAARNLVPHRTLQTLRDDAQWAKEQMR